MVELRDLAESGVIDAAEYERRRRQIITPVDTVSYATGRILIASLIFLALGGVFVWFIVDLNGTGIRVLLSVFAAFGLLVGCFGVRRVVQIRSGDRKAIVIDKEGMDYTLPGGARFEVPWGAVTGVSEKVHETGDSTFHYVVLDLSEPLSRFRVGKASRRADRAGRGSLTLPTDELDVSNKDLVRLIEAHLPEPDTTPGTIGEASSRP